MTNTQSVPSSNSSRTVLYATLAFPPIGIILGWRNGAWSRNAKIGWTAVALIVFVAWGGVVGLLRGSQDVSIWEVLNGIAVAAVAYWLFAIWTNADSSLVRRILMSGIAVLVLAGVGGLGAARTKGPRDLKHGMSPEAVVAIMGEPDWTLNSDVGGSKVWRWHLGRTGEFGFDPDNCVHATFLSGLVRPGKFDNDYQLDVVEVMENGRKWLLPSKRFMKK